MQLNQEKASYTYFFKNCIFIISGYLRLTFIRLARNFISTNMKVTLFSVMIFCLTFPLYSQNLVPNPSFEKTDSVGCSYIANKKEFSTILQDWYMPTTGTADIFQMSAPDSTDCPLHPFSTAVIAIGQAAPIDGSNMIGLYTFFEHARAGCPGYREYAQVKLIEPLIAGEKYYAAFYVSLADSSKYATAPPSLLFSTGPIESDSSCSLIEAEPQVQFTGYAENTKTWDKVSAVFEVGDSYGFITIGSFRRDDQISAREVFEPLNNIFDGAYYYIDSVFVEKIDNLYIPNIITPNGDGFNDKFVIDNLSSDRWILTVVNRYGKRVFKSTYYDNQWDGGGLVSGVYYYSLRYRFTSEIQYKGTITIIY